MLPQQESATDIIKQFSRESVGLEDRLRMVEMIMSCLALDAADKNGRVRISIATQRANEKLQGLRWHQAQRKDGSPGAIIIEIVRPEEPKAKKAKK